MGYLAAAIIMLVVLGIIAATLLRGDRSKSGRISGRGAILREEPSADAPTPARSSTADPRVIERAQKKTLPG